ncbi:tRNA (mnm(5)s(2)U34)-methyltransferase [Faecalicatena contorta]|uniref:rRNA methylase n=1 Tax=Faecalicatena contorta TaxID=39482 RepID=A0A316A3D1_9FIRM|nr:class I SAM-dependent methyltransferase [Faecalicatena contorta]PWJ51450.1 putative rRNA methylase [Faecalicatena contorta]SUQ13006.1 Putative rRNA methylase [Faecalicatena contorta]
MKYSYQITEYCHRFLEMYIESGDICVDATAGNGNDTEFLCRMTGESGQVYAFDIQPQAIECTKERIRKLGFESQVRLIQDGHEKMGEYVKESVSAIVFNFGYLPGGDHRISTQPASSLEAIQEGMKLLKIDGVMSLCIYSGQDSGYEEKEAILSYLKELDSKRWLVIVNSFHNRKNDPPIPVFIIRLK